MLLFQHVQSKKRLGLCGRNSLSVLSSAAQGLVAGALPSPRRTDEGDRVAGMRLCPNSSISTATKTASPDWFELQLPTTRNETKQLRVKKEKNPYEVPNRSLYTKLDSVTMQFAKGNNCEAEEATVKEKAGEHGDLKILLRLRWRTSSAAPPPPPPLCPKSYPPRLLPFLTFISYRCLSNK